MCKINREAMLLHTVTSFRSLSFLCFSKCGFRSQSSQSLWWTSGSPVCPSCNDTRQIYEPTVSVNSVKEKKNVGSSWEFLNSKSHHTKLCTSITTVRNSPLGWGDAPLFANLYQFYKKSAGLNRYFDNYVFKMYIFWMGTHCWQM